MEINCSYSVGGNTYEGTTPKYKLDIDVGIPMSDFNFSVELIGSTGTVTVGKSSMPVDSDGNYYLCFDTKDLGVGKVKAVVTALINDQDFPSGIRKEVAVINNLLDIKEV